MRIFMQPARRSDRIVERHYQDTIVRPVVFGEHADLLDPATASGEDLLSNEADVEMLARLAAATAARRARRRRPRPQRIS
ncbi:hypothetical protein [Streptomyces sp. NPDC058398]|uniref:hypothetical protein n=1 Tax=Streptomyces sp. NPDC058398 TaxID=3346479 RepID=UPI00364E4438